MAPFWLQAAVITPYKFGKQPPGGIASPIQGIQTASGRWPGPRMERAWHRAAAIQQPASGRPSCSRKIVLLHLRSGQYLPDVLLPIQALYIPDLHRMIAPARGD